MRQARLFLADMLPHNTYPYTTPGVATYRRGMPFALDGWL